MVTVSISEKVAAEFVQKIYQELFSDQKQVEFQNVFNNLKNSLVAGFGQVNDPDIIINYKNLNVNQNFIKFKGSNFERFILVVKQFAEEKMDYKGLKAAVRKLITAWKNQGVLQK